MMKTITHFISSSGGARHSFASSALLILLSFLMLLPGVARAEEGTYGNFKFSIGDDDKITITGLVDENVTEVDIPVTIDGKDVVAIGSNAFYKCRSLASVTFAADSKLKTIGAFAFANCYNFYSGIKIPASVEEIGESAFSTSTISSLTFAENAKLKKIGSEAFANCYELSRIEIPASVEELGYNPFAYCPNLLYFFLKRTPQSGVDISFYSNLLTDNQACFLVSKENIEVYKQCLQDYSDRILGYIVSDGLIFADDVLNEGLVCIGYSRDELKNIVIPAKVGDSFVTSIGKRAFYDCSSLSSVSFASDGKLKTIGERAFQGTSFASVNIPASVETIGNIAFADTDKLTSVTFAPDGKLKTIGEVAFCFSSLTSVNIPASVEEILYQAFVNCPYLASVTFAPDGKLKTIGKYTFQGASLNSVNIPASVEEISDGAFSDCRELSFLSFSTDGCLKAIGERAFYMADLTSVSIPASVETIGEHAFGSNLLLESAAFKRSVEEGKNLGGYSTRMFYNCRKLKTIYVPGSSKDAYASLLSDCEEKLVVYDTGTALRLTDEKGVTELTNPSIYVSNALSYSRKVETDKGEYATVCLPFAIKLSETNDVFEKVYVPLNTMIHDQAHSDDTKESFILMLKEQAADAEIPANQPMIVKLADGKDEFIFTNSEDAKLSKDLMPSAISMTVLDWDGTSGLMTENRQFDISYCSLYQAPIPANANTNIWSFNDNGTFGPQTDGMLNPFRLFLHVDGLTAATQAKAYSFSIGVSDGTTTGIREIISFDTLSTVGSSLHDGIIYDLNGRKVTTTDKVKSLPKGIYILNGKKMVVK